MKTSKDKKIILLGRSGPRQGLRKFIKKARRSKIYIQVLQLQSGESGYIGYLK